MSRFRGATLTHNIGVDGDVKLSPYFVESQTLTRLDLLSDWIGILQRAYAIELDRSMGDLHSPCPFSAEQSLWRAVLRIEGPEPVSDLNGGLQ